MKTKDANDIGTAPPGFLINENLLKAIFLKRATTSEIEINCRLMEMTKKQSVIKGQQDDRTHLYRLDKPISTEYKEVLFLILNFSIIKSKHLMRSHL